MKHPLRPRLIYERAEGIQYSVDDHYSHPRDIVSLKEPSLIYTLSRSALRGMIFAIFESRRQLKLLDDQWQINKSPDE